MSEIKLIPVSKLLLDLENPRFPEEVTGQRAAINLMLKIQEDKITNLAKDIAVNGLDPSENLMVFESDDEPGFYVVAEGNRRTTALKLLANPNSADSEKFKKIFNKIKESATNSISKVSCVVFDDEGYEHWVNLKHTGDNKGVGRSSWTTPEADRYREKHGKTSIQRQLYDFMERQEEAYADILMNKKFVHATNLSRLFGDKRTKRCFGLTTMDGYLYSALPFNEFVGKLKKILEVMTEVSDGKNSPDFNVKRIYKKEDRADFLNELGFDPEPQLLPHSWKLDDPKAGYVDKDPQQGKAEEELPKPQGEVENKGQKNNDVKDDEVDEPNKPKIINKPIPNTNRNSLVPSTLKLNFGGDMKCSKIFYELKNKLGHDETPYSLAVMLRVFIDLSTTAFMEKKGIKYVDTKQPTRSPGLHDKVVECCKYLKEQGLLTQPQVTAICTFSKDKLKADGSLQQYVHNQHLKPSKDIVNTEWDNFQPLFEKIWSTEMQVINKGGA
ncbi:hypothetical protein NQ674_07850 [Acinetobacter baumannii]|nr:hypothetical protein [Acinetobacter baumannii]MDC4391231.1 hypothetical protein [Acinetobacter baumannii]